MDVTKTYKFAGVGDIHGPKPYNPAVFKDAFYVVLVSPPPGGSGGQFGLSFSQGYRGFCADSGPDPGGRNSSFILILVSRAPGIKS